MITKDKINCLQISWEWIRGQNITYRELDVDNLFQYQFLVRHHIECISCDHLEARSCAPLQFDAGAKLLTHGLTTTNVMTSY